MPFWRRPSPMLEHAEWLGSGDARPSRSWPEAREIFARLGRRRGSSGPACRPRRWPGDLRAAAAPRTRPGEVLPDCGTALAAACPTCGVVPRRPERFCGECGTPLGGAAARSAGFRACRAGGRAAPRLGAVRRPRRLHVGVGGARRRGHARAALPLLRHCPAADRALRRHGREVHRRRGDGGVGDAGRERGRRRARGAGGARPGRRGARARPCARGAGGGADRRGGGDGRRGRPGHGRRRPREHRVARPVGRRAGHRARRRGDEAGDRGGDRLRARRRARAEGEGRDDGALPGAARAGRARRRPALGGPGAAVRRPRPRAAHRQGALPRQRGGAQGAPRLGDRDRRHRQVAARLGVREVHGRPRRGGLVAPRPLPRLRRGRRLLGARRDGAHAGRDRRGRGEHDRPAEAPGHRRAARPRRRGARVDRAAARPAARARRVARRRSGRTCSPRGGSSSSGWQRKGRACSSSRTSSGPSRASSTSSSTCSSGRGASRSSCSRSSRPEAGSSLAGSARNATTLSLEPLTVEAMEALLDGFVPGLPDDLRAEILARAEGVPLYAVETVRMLLDRGLLAREGDAYRPTGPIEELDVPETLHALLAARLDGLDPEERAIVADAAVLGKTFTKQGVAALAGRDEDDVERILRDLIRKEVLTRPGRRTLARARPVRLPPGPAEARRLRDALQDRPEGAPPRRCAPHLDRVGGRGDRRDRRRPLPGGVSPLPRGRRRGRAQRHGAGCARPCRGACGVAGGDGRGGRCLRAGGRARRRSARGGAAARAGRALGLSSAATWRRPARARNGRTSSTRQPGRRARRRSSRLGSRTPNGSSTRPTGRWSGSRRPTPFSSEGERDEGFAAVAAELGRAQFFMGDLESAAAHRSTRRSRPPSGSGCRRRSPRG